MKNFKNFIRTLNLHTITNIIDCFILIIVIFALVGNFIFLVSSLIHILCEFFNVSGYNFICQMVGDNAPTETTTNISNTTTTIIHSDGSWSNTIRSLFIYGTGAYRLHFLRAGGTPGSRAFVITSTIVTDTVTRVINNTINDPSYVKNNYMNWKAIWLNQSEGSAGVQVDTETLNKLSNVTKNNFVGDGSNINELVQSLINSIFENLQFILEPVQVNYSTEMLADQIYHISILLFIVSILITGLIIVLLLNIFLYINMDRIINYFNNKFIKWYLTFNKKILGMEIFLLGGTILYFMYSLSVGLRFIATHPIIIN